MISSVCGNVAATLSIYLSSTARLSENLKLISYTQDNNVSLKSFRVLSRLRATNCLLNIRSSTSLEYSGVSGRDSPTADGLLSAGLSQKYSKNTRHISSLSASRTSFKKG